MNRIDSIKFDFRMQNENFARQLYAGWDRFFAQNFEEIADEVLSRFEPYQNHTEIEKLNLDLGTISEQDFYDEFPRKVREKLEEALYDPMYPLFNPELPMLRRADHLRMLRGSQRTASGRERRHHRAGRADLR